MRGQHWIAVLPLLFAGSLVAARARALGHADPRARADRGRARAALARAAARCGPASRSRSPGSSLTAAGAGLLLTRGGTSFGVLAPGAVLGALLLVVGPWLWQLARERDAERTARIRSDERAEVAARVHDSVLQTLALVQRHADEPRRVASLARRQERELRSWLYGDGAAPGDTLEGALAAAADEIEELHGVRVELASGGDCALTDDVRAVVLAAREAMANAAKFSGRRRDLGLRRGRRRARQRLRPRPRRRLRPRVGAGRPPRPRRVDRGPHGARRRHGGDRLDARARAPRSS